MPGVVQMRLALTYLAQLDSSIVKIDYNFHTAVFPERTSSATDFLAILQRLCDEGYVTKAGHGLLRTTATAEKIQEGQTAYLDPLAGITQHVSTFIHHVQLVLTINSMKWSVTASVLTHAGETF